MNAWRVARRRWARRRREVLSPADRKRLLALGPERRVSGYVVVPAPPPADATQAFPAPLRPRA